MWQQLAAILSPDDIRAGLSSAATSDGPGHIGGGGGEGLSQEAEISVTACWLIPVACCLLSAYRLQFAAYCLLLAAYLLQAFLPLSSCLPPHSSFLFLPPSSSSLLPPACCLLLLPITCCLSPSLAATGCRCRCSRRAAVIASPPGAG